MSAEPDLDPSAGADTLQLLVGGGGGTPEQLLLIERATSDGHVRVRSWTSDDWSAPPTTSTRNAAELLRDIEHWSRTGRSLNQSLAIVRRWMEGS